MTHWKSLLAAGFLAVVGVVATSETATAQYWGGYPTYPPTYGGSFYPANYPVIGMPARINPYSIPAYPSPWGYPNYGANYGANYNFNYSYRYNSGYPRFGGYGW